MSIRILLIEDNTGDVRLMREILLGTNNAIQLLVISDGAEALTFLKQEGIHVDAPRPDLILLDLNLPKINGREVLAHIKSDASLRSIPIIVLTTSDAEVDIVKSYQLQANCYLSKPGQLNEFEMLVRSMSDFWLNKGQVTAARVRRGIGEPDSAGCRLTSRSRLATMQRADRRILRFQNNQSDSDS